nr:MAG TPA: hypothetical protein [Caudoviricetes sp.]
MGFFMAHSCRLSCYACASARRTEKRRKTA